MYKKCIPSCKGMTHQIIEDMGCDVAKSLEYEHICDTSCQCECHSQQLLAKGVNTENTGIIIKSCKIEPYVYHITTNKAWPVKINTLFKKIKACHRKASTPSLFKKRCTKNAINTFKGLYWCIISTYIENSKFIIDILFYNPAKNLFYVEARSNSENKYFQLPKQWNSYIMFKATLKFKHMDHRIISYTYMMNNPSNLESLKLKDSCKLYINSSSSCIDKNESGVHINTGLNAVGIRMNQILIDQSKQIKTLQNMITNLYKKDEPENKNKCDMIEDINMLYSEINEISKRLL